MTESMISFVGIWSVIIAAGVFLYVAIPRSDGVADGCDGVDSSFMRKKRRANNGSADHVHGARRSPMKTWSTTAMRLLLGRRFWPLCGVSTKATPRTTRNR
jgi:hypothetical protein